MSRIYEALKQSGEAKPNAIIDLIQSDSPRNDKKAAPDPAHKEAAPKTDGRADGARRTEPAAKSAAAESTAVPIREGWRVVAAEPLAGRPVLPFQGSDPRAAEKYRILRTNILQHPRRPKVIAISSAGPGDGKTITAINLAGILALKAEVRVLLIDADMRRSGVANALGLDRSPGLTEVLQDQFSLESAIVRVEQMPNLHVLAAGEPIQNPADLLESHRWKSMLSTVRDQFHFIVIDTTPADVVADCRLVEQVADGVAIVLRPDHTVRSEGMRAIDFPTPDKFLGVVINDFKDWLLFDSDESYDYYQYYNSEKKRPSSFWRRLRS